MSKNKRKSNVFNILLFTTGLMIYLAGLLLVFFASINKTPLSNILFSKVNLTNEIIKNMKILGIILFILGFIIFMVAIIFLYKKDEIKENNVNLIIEGKADVITLIIMTYVMIFMIVICLILNELVAALLIGVTIIIQCILNYVLIKYFNALYKKK